MGTVPYQMDQNSDNLEHGKQLGVFTCAVVLTMNTCPDDQYLKTIIEATNVLSNHRLDNEGEKKAQSDDKSLNTTNTSASASNSTSRNSSARENLELSLAQLEGCCYCCGKRGHKSRVFT